MNILVTGVNPVQCGHTPRVSYISSIQCVLGVLKELNHNVCCRFTGLNEDLKAYDLIILYAAPVTGFVGRYAPQAMQILYKALLGELNVVLSYDDWQVEPILGSIKSLTNRIDKVVDGNQFGWYENSFIVKQELAKQIETLSAGNWPLKSIAPVWPGGDVAKLNPPASLDLLTTYSPNSFFRDRYKVVPRPGPEDIGNHWVLAALHDHRPWLKKQNVSWPVHQYGKKKAGMEKLQEHGIYAKYCLSSGVLSPSYKHSGSGWWRARYGLAADCLRPIAGDGIEASMLGDAYCVTPSDVEALSSSERLELAHYQREAYYYNPAHSKETLIASISEVLK